MELNDYSNCRMRKACRNCCTPVAACDKSIVPWRSQVHAFRKIKTGSRFTLIPLSVVFPIIASFAAFLLTALDDLMRGSCGNLCASILPRGVKLSQFEYKLKS